MATNMTGVWHIRLLFFCLLVNMTGCGRARAEGPLPGLRITVPAVVMSDVPVAWIRIEAVLPDGQLDRSAEGLVRLRGIRVESSAEPAWELIDGQLVIESRPEEGLRIYLDRESVEAELDDGRQGRLVVSPASGWFRLVPPVVAIVLAVVVRNVYIALLVAIWSGVSVLLGGDSLTAFWRTLVDFLPRELTEPGGDGTHMRIIFFTLFLGAMIGVMSRSGGTHALVARFTRLTTSRRHGQVMTWLLGLVVFFDDYANTMLVGSTMRSVCDRLRISREKLAYLVDATAAPVAGLAVISTWVGFEVSQIASSFENLGVQTDNVFQIFLATIPYRFYPIWLLVFTAAIAWSGKDFGPMFKAEQTHLRGHANEEVSSGANSMSGVTGSDELTSLTDRPLVRNAVVPLLGLLACLAIGMAFHSHDSVPVLLVSSFVGAALAVGQAVMSGSLSLESAINAWLDGARGMFIGVVILVLSWSIGTLCDESHLNTAGFIVDLIGESLEPAWLPAISFVVSSIVSFATGSSFATMGLLIPLFVSVTFALAQGDPSLFSSDPVTLATIGSVLSGAIFGDHCSPISDTTVLSSMSAGCDHLRHVATQLPYALTVGAVSLLFGYLPAGLGIPAFWTLPLGVLVLIGILAVIGKRAELT